MAEKVKMGYNISMRKLEEVSKIIKEKIEELKILPDKAGQKAKENKEKLKNAIEDLNKTQKVTYFENKVVTFFFAPRIMFDQ